MMRKLTKLITILFFLVFIGMQFVSIPGASKTSTAGTPATETGNPQVGKI